MKKAFGGMVSAGLACIGLWLSFPLARSEETPDEVRREAERLGLPSYEDREKAGRSLEKRLEELEAREDRTPFLAVLRQLDDFRKKTSDAEIVQRLEPLLERFWPPERLGERLEERKKQASDPPVYRIPELPPGHRDPLNDTVAFDGVARFSFRYRKTLFVAGTAKGVRKPTKYEKPGSSWVASLDASAKTGKRMGIVKKEIRGEITGMKAGDRQLIVESIDKESDDKAFEKWVTIFRLECDLPEREVKKPK